MTPLADLKRDLEAQPQFQELTILNQMVALAGLTRRHRAATKGEDLTTLPSIVQFEPLTKAEHPYYNAGVPPVTEGAEPPPDTEDTAPEPGVHGMDAADLLAKTIAPLREAVPGILPEGLGVIAAPPKAGKSMLAYQMAVELTLGNSVLGRRVEKRPVLYYALEDGERRSQARILGALAGRALPRGLTLRWDAPRLGAGLETEVSGYLTGHPAGVVIIDVLAKVRPDGKRGLNAYDEDYNVLSGLHEVAKQHPGSVILLVTHDRKAGSEDWMSRITGTRGVSGAADFCIFIMRDRGTPTGTIVTTGRDIEDVSIGVRFDGAGWQVADVAVLLQTVSATRQTIWKYVEANAPVWQKAIAEGTGLSESVVYHRVADMAKDGQLASTPQGYVPGEVDPEGGQWQ